jgi:hypothetical protein
MADIATTLATENIPVGSSSEITASDSITTTSAGGIEQTFLANLSAAGITNPSQSSALTAEKMAKSTNVNLGASLLGGNTTKIAASPATPATAVSATPPVPTPVMPSFNGAKDQRTRLLVPKSYLVGQTAGPNKELLNSGGIIFPYTPSIGLEHNANYSPINAMHSNYTQFFYKNSQVSEIAVTAKFTVQNEKDAGILLAVNHLLRALTKMRFGNDSNAGSPPPVCRLMAWGDYMLDNVPVAVKSFKLELSDSVDYFTIGSATAHLYGVTSVPVMTTISLSLVPLYSRKEMMNGTVTGWLTDNQRAQGYL